MATVIRRAPRGASRERTARTARTVRAASRPASSPAAIRKQEDISFLMLGALGSAGMGLVQKHVNLPAIEGIPNTLSYGTAAVALGVLIKSPLVTKIGAGPFFAGVHHIMAHPIGKTDQLSGEDDDSVSGEFDQLGAGDPYESSLEGEFSDVVSGDFDDL